MRYAELLLETRYAAPLVIRKAAKQVLYDLKGDNGGFETVLWELGYHPNQNEDDFNHEKFQNSRKFKSELKQWAIDKCEEVKYRIEWALRESNYTVWRMITAPENWVPDPNRHPGIYWSWDVSAAEAHWAENHDCEYLLTAQIKDSDIDWVSTIAQNANPSLGEQEKEVCVYHNSKFPYTYKQVS